MYGFLSPTNTIESSKSNNKGDIGQKRRICNFVTPVSPMGWDQVPEGKYDCIFRLPVFPITHQHLTAVNSIINVTLAKNTKISDFMTHVWPRGRLGN